MENNFEKRRFRAQCVALVDMGFLFLQTLIFIGSILLGLLMVILMPKTYHVFIILTTITFVIIVVQFYATIRLLSATKKENNVGTDKTICWTKFWYYLNILVLLLGVLVELITFKSQPFWALVVGVVIVFIRVYMLWTALMYLKAVQECVAEGANIELQAVYATSSSPEENQSPAAQV